MHKANVLLFIGYKFDTHGAVGLVEIQRSQNSTLLSNCRIMMIDISGTNDIADIADYDNVIDTIEKKYEQTTLLYISYALIINHEKREYNNEQKSRIKSASISFE